MCSLQWDLTYRSVVCVCFCLQDPEAAQVVGKPSRAWCWCFYLGLALMLSGVVVGGAYLYRYYVLEVGSLLSPVCFMSSAKTKCSVFNYQCINWRTPTSPSTSVNSVVVFVLIWWATTNKNVSRTEQLTWWNVRKLFLLMYRFNHGEALGSCGEQVAPQSTLKQVLLEN